MLSQLSDTFRRAVVVSWQLLLFDNNYYSWDFLARNFWSGIWMAMTIAKVRTKTIKVPGDRDVTDATKEMPHILSFDSHVLNKFISVFTGISSDRTVDIGSIIQRLMIGKIFCDQTEMCMKSYTTCCQMIKIWGASAVIGQPQMLHHVPAIFESTSECSQSAQNQSENLTNMSSLTMTLLWLYLLLPLNIVKSW